MKVKNVLSISFLILSALILGTLITNWAADVPWLSWLNYGKSIGIGADTPAVIDLSVLKITFGAQINLNAIQCILIGLAIYANRKWFK